MYFDSFAAFLTMGGHGVYVWTCYGVVTAVISGLFMQPLLKKRQFLAQQQQVLKRQQRDQGAS